MSSSEPSALIYLISFAYAIFMAVCMWRIYEKAGAPGWTSLIPIYNIYVMIKIADKPGWWVLLMFVPVISIIVSIVVIAGFLAELGKDEPGSVLMYLFLSPFYIPYLAFSSDV